MPDELQGAAAAEMLARSFMGWKRGQEVYPVDAAQPLDWYFQHNRTWWRKTDWFWNPFTDANADLQVLERVREVWGQDDRRWALFESALAVVLSVRRDVVYTTQGTVGIVASMFKVGCWSRAALAVLKERETEAER